MITACTVRVSAAGTGLARAVPSEKSPVWKRRDGREAAVRRGGDPRGRGWAASGADLRERAGTRGARWQALVGDDRGTARGRLVGQRGAVERGGADGARRLRVLGGAEVGDGPE